MLKGANRIQWRIRFLEMTEVSATDLHMSRKFQNFFCKSIPSDWLEFAIAKHDSANSKGKAEVANDQGVCPSGSSSK